MNDQMDSSCCAYDEQLNKLPHYGKYPEMRVWVGKNYPGQLRKVLLIAESHYVGKKFQFHHDPAKWYAGIHRQETSPSRGFLTREIIADGIKDKWRKKAAAIYRNIDRALCASTLLADHQGSAFTEVAFMNYFQRPAEEPGKSIKVCPQDIQVAQDVFQAVVLAIRPDAVIFTSALAYHYACQSNAKTFLNKEKIKFVRTPHPGMPWWNRASKKYGGRTGKQVFTDFVNSKLKGQNDLIDTDAGDQDQVIR